MALAHLAEEVQAPATWGHELAAVPLDGRGLRVGNLDEGIDPFHPAFFRADGALHAWIDVDGNGWLDPGVDAVDLDSDGKAGPKETLGALIARVYEPYSATFFAPEGTSSETFHPATGWLYVDANRNRTRDFGPQAGFDDSDPTLGELLLVGEDLDGDGKIGVHEKLRALGTPKVVAFRHEEQLFRRGENLSQTPLALQAPHGTGTSGIIVGGQRGYLRHVGIAPGAELVVAATTSTPAASLVWLVDEQKVDVVLHTRVAWTNVHLDGSSNLEGLIDEASGQGVPQVVAAGNLLTADDKHASVTLAAQSTTKVPFRVPTASQRQVGLVTLTLLWRQPQADLSFVLEDPSGTQRLLSLSNTKGSIWSPAVHYYSYRSDSTRGTAMVDLVLVVANAGGSIPAGQWVLHANNATAVTSQLHGYLYDDANVWQKGAGFAVPEQVSPTSTLCWPATADQAITVTAYAGHSGPPHEPVAREPKGALRSYASRGPRIDGELAIDIAAPDTPVAPVSHAASIFNLGDMVVFPGTSSSAPIVAGAVTLLRQHDPGLDVAGIKQALGRGAQVAPSMAPADWGQGKLRIYSTIFGTAPPPNTRPEVAIEHPEVVHAGQPVTFVARVHDAEDGSSALRLRWDAGYDGDFEPELAGRPQVTMTFDEPGPRRVKLEAVDSGGLRAAAAVLLEVQPAVPSSRPDGGAASDVGPAPTSDAAAGNGAPPSGSSCAIGHAPGAAWWGLLLVVLLRRRRVG